MPFIQPTLNAIHATPTKCSSCNPNYMQPQQNATPIICNLCNTNDMQLMQPQRYTTHSTPTIYNLCNPNDMQLIQHQQCATQSSSWGFFMKNIHTPYKFVVSLFLYNSLRVLFIAFTSSNSCTGRFVPKTFTKKTKTTYARSL